MASTGKEKRFEDNPPIGFLYNEIELGFIEKSIEYNRRTHKTNQRWKGTVKGIISKGTLHLYM